METFTRRFIVALILLLLTACTQNGGITMGEGVELSGFQTFPTPRTFDGPGTVFRIAPDRTRFSVAKLNVPIDQVGVERFANYTKTDVWSLATVIKYVGAPQLLSDAQVSANLGSSLELTLQIGQGSRERTYDADVTAALNAASIEYRVDSRYYIIRETIGVSDLSYRFTRKKDLTSGVTAALIKTVQATGSLQWVSSEQTDLVQKFDRLHRVFYTAEEIIPSVGLLGAEPERRRVKEPLEWTTENR